MAPPITESSSPFPGPSGALYHRSLIPLTPWSSLAIVHGYGDHSARHVPAMRFLANHGIATHALDLRGQGNAEGRRGFVLRWEDYLDDLDAFLALPELRDA